MKTSVMIAGVCCLLALSFTLSECQDSGCTSIDSDLQDCINEYRDNPDNTDVLCGDCRSTLEEYADDCLGAGAEAYRNGLDAACGAAGENGAGSTVEAAALSTISALVVAMAAVFN